LGIYQEHTQWDSLLELVATTMDPVNTEQQQLSQENAFVQEDMPT